MPRVATAIVSDLHLGTVTGADIARRGEPRERLLAALDGADRVVLLGDTLELRELPLACVLELARPFFEALGEVTAERRVTLLVGNHDHQLAEPWLTQLRIDGGELAPANEWTVEPGHGPAGRLAELMPATGLTVAYPGVLLRPDVYATHGHYLDLHLTVPRPESLAAGLMGRLTGRGRECRSAAEYETVLSPMYAFYARLAESADSFGVRRGSSLSRTVWKRVNDDRSGALVRLLLGRVTIPAGVAILNRVGLGPLGPDVSGTELRRSGLRAMARAAEGLGVEAEHIVFGHTHRPGPLAGDDPGEWRTPRGARLWNAGTWLHEPVFMGAEPRRSPYWPGTVLRLPAEGEPELDNALPELSLAL
jgi:Calcineurin-like phosphoesterase